MNGDIFFIHIFFFFFNDTATTEIYTLSLHDALPICRPSLDRPWLLPAPSPTVEAIDGRSEEHTSELQSRRELVCRLLLEKTNKNTTGAFLALQGVICFTIRENLRSG